jgi:hypothetical protein
VAIQHLFTFKTEEDAKIFQQKVHLNLQDVATCIHLNEVTVIDGKHPPQSEAIARLAENSTGTFAKVVR